MKYLFLVLAIGAAVSACTYRSETVQRPVPATVVAAPPPPPTVVYVPQ
jgi:hypothetical protein